ncbi:uncharacterized protein ATNIH1004_009544 [Aspergillus tanneri]|uniref:NmrA-like domain-containing protein n=1 Tax=Aspergillus tanneri TaxID=1220188 RepID=A0A5M9M6X6_9EURO|nr:uncharacterized protein ATNIH1004_009544 [Aspergillus tanneri]KAA8642792.1 hypothetical protein ATNIH1004_009544 [Aspergillus tanneri]
MSVPSVAIFGPHGFIGKEIVPTFVEALSKKEISSLKLLTRNPTSSVYNTARSRGASICPVAFSDRPALRRLLEGVDVVISCMGTSGNYKENKKELVDACAEAKVKIYLPSEWGTDHRQTHYHHPMFTSKQEHHSYAEKLGLKTIALYTGLIMETSFCKWLGFDTKDRTWNIVESGNRLVAMTSQKDLGPATLRTILLAYSTPEKCPSHIRIYSDNRSIRDYQAIFESESKEKLKLNCISLRDAETDYERIKASIPPNKLGPLINLLFADGTFDHTSNEREIINPGQHYFQWRSVDNYAKEVNGLPWENESPW